MLEREEGSIDKKVTTGIEKLDKITNGGFYKGSITAVIGNTGTGKTTFGIHLYYAKAVFITLNIVRGV